MHEQLSVSERRAIAGLASLLYLTLTGYKAAVPQFAVSPLSLPVLHYQHESSSEAVKSHAGAAAWLRAVCKLLEVDRLTGVSFGCAGSGGVDLWVATLRHYGAYRSQPFDAQGAVTANSRGRGSHDAQCCVHQVHHVQVSDSLQ
jgi:hypothetical protein